MTATMITRRRKVMETVQSATDKVDWGRAIHITFWSGLGLFWTLLAMVYFMGGGWYITGGFLFALLAVGHFGMATQSY